MCLKNHAAVLTQRDDIANDVMPLPITTTPSAAAVVVVTAAAVVVVDAAAVATNRVNHLCNTLHIVPQRNVHAMGLRTSRKIVELPIFCILCRQSLELIRPGSRSAC